MDDGARGAGPYAEAAWAYRAAGWLGVLPLPAGAKSPPPGGYTGWAGVDPSGADIQAWVDGHQGAGNIGLHLPSGVYGLDVDDYGAKTGASALERLVAAYGPLPPTWTVTSREESASGIRLFRAELPTGYRWRDEPAGRGAGIEAIHRGHRYAVVWPSMHPEGRKYRWRRPDGIVAAEGELPDPVNLPGLPPAWIEGVAELGEVRAGEMAGHDETVSVVAGWREGGVDGCAPCPPVIRAAERAMSGLAAGAAGAALHPVAVAALHELANLGHEGHADVRRALAEHYSAFVEVRKAREPDGRTDQVASAEWWRMVRGAIGKLPIGSRRQVCDCDLRAGEGVQWDPYSGPDALPLPAVTGQDLPVDMAGELIARMLGPAQLRDLPPPAWLVEGLLTLDSASWLIAAAGSYKSFVALDWAGHVGGGRAWMGRQVRAGPVVYVVAEGAGGMGPRIRAWEQRNGAMAAAVRFLPMPIQVGRPDHWSALVEACRRLAPALVILDTQARITVGLDENDNTAMGEVVEAIERLRRACGACVLTVHHTGRSGTHARGASAIDGAQDAELKLTRTADRRVTLSIDKSKNAPDDVRVDLELFPCEIDGVAEGSLVIGAPLSAVTLAPWQLEPIDRMLRIQAVLHDQFSEHGATAAQVLAVLREKGWTDDYPKTTFYRWWNELQRADKIERVHGSQRWILIPSTSVEVSP